MANADTTPPSGGPAPALRDSAPLAVQDRCRKLLRLRALTHALRALKAAPVLPVTGTLAATVLVICLAGLLTGCGGAGNDTPTPPAQTHTQPAPVTAAPGPLPAQAAPACTRIYGPKAADAAWASLPSCEYIGDPSRPLVVVLALSAQMTLESRYAWDGIPHLLSAGYSLLSLDLPCHGADQPPDGDNLKCWAERIHGGDRDIFLRFCSQLSDAMDELHVSQAAIVGVSRGGYAAITCAAYDVRFKDVVLVAPVTDLNYLAEFKELPVDEVLFNTGQYVPYLQGRANLLRVGAHDTRVGTSIAEIFGHKIGATEQILPTTGHYAPEDGSTVTFLQSHLWYE